MSVLLGYMLVQAFTALAAQGVCSAFVFTAAWQDAPRELNAVLGNCKIGFKWKILACLMHLHNEVIHLTDAY